MPEVHEPGKHPEENGKRHFINEKVVKPPLSRKQVAKYTLALVCAAAAFGGVAAVSFVVTRPLAEHYLGKETPAESSVSIPKDEIPTSAAEEIPEESSTEASEPIEDKVQSVLENYRYTTDDLNSMIGSLRTQVQKSSQGIVVVHSVQQDTDWFDNAVETSGQYAGAVIAETDQELLILTPEAAVEAADSIKVTFNSGSDVDGRIKQKDSASGMAVVSVSVADLDVTTLKTVSTIPLGNSYTVREGDLIAAVGGPAGMVHSVDYGFVSYVLKNAAMTDQWNRVVYANIMSDADTGTFFLNTSGELIGWDLNPSIGLVGGEASDEADQSMPVTEVMGVSDYKVILERLSNGLGAPSFGIVGQEVTEAQAEATPGLPRGIYVVSVLNDRPAYSAGIQNGDIIVEADGREIETMKDFQSMMENLECGQLINVTVQRNGREAYAELEFQLTVGAR